MRKVFIIFAITTLFLLALVSTASAIVYTGPNTPGTRTAYFWVGSNQYQVVVNGVTTTETMDAAPYYKNGRVMLPIRYVARAMGIDDSDPHLVSYEPKRQEVVLARMIKLDKLLNYEVVSGAVTIFHIGSNKCVWSGIFEIKMDVVPEIVDGRVYVPLRAAAQSLGGLCYWNDAEKKVTIVTVDGAPESTGWWRHYGTPSHIGPAQLTLTKDSTKVINYLFDTSKKTVTYNSKYPILRTSPGNPKLLSIDPIEMLQYGEDATDNLYIVDTVNKGLLLIDGMSNRPFGMVYMKKDGTADYWLGAMNCPKKELSYYDQKMYIVNNRVYTGLTGYELAYLVTDKDVIYPKASATMLVSREFSLQ